ncbi:MAG: hypothetical protein ACK55I_07245, partial [bacterium]
RTSAQSSGSIGVGAISSCAKAHEAARVNDSTAMPWVRICMHPLCPDRASGQLRPAKTALPAADCFYRTCAPIRSRGGSATRRQRPPSRFRRHPRDSRRSHRNSAAATRCRRR